MDDKKFYDILNEEDRPVDDQHLVLDSAKIKAKRYNLDNRIYIVRGYEMFVVHSDDIKVTKNVDGSRKILVESGKMVKYTEDGKRQADE